MEIHRFVDVAFPVEGHTLPADHGYLLYSALCSHVPRLRSEPSWGVHPIVGRRTEPSRLKVFQHSMVQIRLPATELGEVMFLGTRSLRVGPCRLRLGVPGIYPLHPARRLRSHCVSIGGHEKPRRFEEALRYELSGLDLPQSLERIEVHVGERKYVQTWAHDAPGFAVTLANLSPEASLCLQARGVGERRSHGLGLFVPRRSLQAVGAA